MKKNILLFVFSLSVSCTFYSIHTSAKSKTNLEVLQYNQSYIDEQWEKADSQPIHFDKEMTFSAINKQELNNSYGYPGRRGVILVTKDAYKHLIPTGHAGILWDSATVIEAHADGVATGVNNWYLVKNSCYGVTLADTTPEQDAQAAYYCYNQIGKSYNFNYFNTSTRDKFYCSQLVYAAYIDLFGIDLDTSEFGCAIHPMELVNTSKTYTIYKK